MAPGCNKWAEGTKIPKSQLKVEKLPRGGTLVQWGDFRLQVGAYPETIKDTINTEAGVPNLFVLPESLFDLQNGTSLAELEFPLYYNYYVKGQKLRFICRPHQQRPLYRLLREAVFGPSSFRLEREFPHGSATFGFPDLAAEARFYKQVNGRILKLSDYIDPIVCSSGDSVDVDEVKIRLLEGNEVSLEQNGSVEIISFDPLPVPKFSFDGVSSFDPPDFGVTVLGAGHGFDVDSRTSGFIIWLDGKGLLVDPPVHTTEWMKVRNLDARLVEDILLTHCHADHDSGTLQKIMEEGRVRLHTTSTVMESFVRKYRSLIGLERDELEKLFDFQPVILGPKVNILGARFRFWYTFHPVPTLGFQVEHRRKTFAYSCDTLYDPHTFDDLNEQGIISDERREILLNFPWASDLIFHEAGIPPIHTPTEILANLPREVRQRMYLTHVSQDAIKDESRLKIAPTGLSNTLVLAPRTEDLESGDRATQLLDILLHAEIFADCPIQKSLEFLHIAQTRRVEAGVELITEGEWGDFFFLVARGEVGIYREQKLVRVLKRYDFFGEMAIVLDSPRFASVSTLSECELVTISRTDFIKFIANTDLPELLRRVANNKLNDLWPVMKSNRSLRPLTPFQRGQLLSILEPRDYAAGEVLFSPGGLPLDLFLVAEGKVRVINRGGAETEVGRGAMIARFPEKNKLVTHEVQAETTAPSRIFVAPLSKLRVFFQRNPGTYIRLSRMLRDDPFSTIPGQT